MAEGGDQDIECLNDIGIPNGPVEEGTRGSLKAHESTNMEFGSPISYQ
jgi:hypothetical protein